MLKKIIFFLLSIAITNQNKIYSMSKELTLEETLYQHKENIKNGFGFDDAFNAAQENIFSFELGVKLACLKIINNIAFTLISIMEQNEKLPDFDIDNFTKISLELTAKIYLKSMQRYSSNNVTISGFASETKSSINQLIKLKNDLEQKIQTVIIPSPNIDQDYPPTKDPILFLSTGKITFTKEHKKSRNCEIF